MEEKFLIGSAVLDHICENADNDVFIDMDEELYIHEGEDPSNTGPHVYHLIMFTAEHERPDVLKSFPTDHDIVLVAAIDDNRDILEIDSIWLLSKYQDTYIGWQIAKVPTA